MPQQGFVDLYWGRGGENKHYSSMPVGDIDALQQWQEALQEQEGEPGDLHQIRYFTQRTIQQVGNLLAT